MLTTTLLHASLCSLLVADPGSVAPAPPVDEPAPVGPRRAMKAGSGLMAGGGTLMVVGAAVLVPMGVAGAARAQQPDPRTYTAVEPFRQDMLAYRSTVERSMKLGLAGSITAVVGATVFVAGAITFGAARHRARRHGPRLSLLPTRRGGMASLTGRF